LKASIILPTYNERDNILELIQSIQGHVEPIGLEYEIVVVDDNSPDGTAAAVQDEFADDSRIRTLVRTERGLASAIQHGILNSAGEIIVVMDTDFNHDPKMIPQMVKFLEYYDIIIGSRFVMAGGMEDKTRYYFSFIYNLFIRILFQTQVQDNLSGFFSIYRDKLMEMDLDRIFYGYGDYFIRLLITAWRKKLAMLEVPVFYRLRLHGHSKTQAAKVFWQYTSSVIRLRLKGIK
jgi:dolichol-phosphate mannosyltransferase